jgi:hypothetical protein
MQHIVGIYTTAGGEVDFNIIGLHSFVTGRPVLWALIERSSSHCVVTSNGKTSVSTALQSFHQIKR